MDVVPSRAQWSEIRNWSNAMQLPFANRIEAGRHLAPALAQYRGRTDVLVLGLPRGGVPVAYEVAKALDAPLDVIVVRKLGVPGQEELALGAVASGGLCILNHDVVNRAGITEAAIQGIIEDEMREIRRREDLYRGKRSLLKLSGHCVILVDDGLATGATMRAAVALVREEGPSQVVVAVPVGADEAVQTLRAIADEVVCLAEPVFFRSVGQWYVDFAQTSDDEVRELLNRRAAERSSRPQPIN